MNDRYQSFWSFLAVTMIVVLLIIINYYEYCHYFQPDVTIMADLAAEAIFHFIAWLSLSVLPLF